MFPAIFLDRDGVIIENRPDYVRSWEDVEFIPQALSALASLSDSSYKIVIVTNQAGIGRGLIQLGEAEAINRQLVSEITQAGGRIDGIFMCPHTPTDQCNCRKPRPGLFLQASQALSLDLDRSLAVGDKWSDLLAAQNAGISKLILVKTGLGVEQLRYPKPPELGEVLIHENLAEALILLFQLR